MQISQAKLEANRANAQKSTGPTSEFGKAMAAQNAIVHGLCGKFRVLESESQEDYNALLQRFMDAEKPVDSVEEELVAKMARATWMSERAVRFQSGCFSHTSRSEQQVADDEQTIQVQLKELEKFTRYQTTQDRAYERAAAALAKRKKQREMERRGFESQKRAEAAEVARRTRAAGR